MDTQPQPKSYEYLQDNSRVVLTEHDISHIPWLQKENLIPANFTGSNHSKKFLLKNDNETVIRRSGYQIHPRRFEKEMPLREAALTELGRLSGQFNIHVPEYDFQVVNPYLVDPVADRDLGDEHKDLDPVSKFNLWPHVGLDVYVKTEYIHGQSLADIENFDPELLAEADQLAGNLVWYFTQGYMANPDQNFIGLSDIISIEQYMWGFTSSHPESKHIYLNDLEMKAEEYEPDNFYEGVFREIATVYWDFLKPIEDKSSTTLAHARQQLEHAISLIQHHDPENASEIKRAISLQSPEEFEDEFFY